MRPIRVLSCVLLVLVTAPPLVAGTTDRAIYQRTLSREQALARRKAAPSAADVRSVVNAYRDLVARFPKSPYADNALWQAAGLSLSLHARTGTASDRQTAVRLLSLMVSEYPSSSLRGKARSRLRSIETSAKAPAPKRATTPPARSAARDVDIVPMPAPERIVARDMPVEPRPVPPSAPPAGPAAQLRDVRRTVLPDVVRVTLELDSETTFEEQRIDGPPRVFFDLRNVTAAAPLEDATVSFDGDVVRSVRLGRRPDRTTRVVMDLDGVQRYSVFTLYNPFRLVVDFERAQAVAAVPLPSRALPLGMAAGAGLPASATPTSGRSAGARGASGVPVPPPVTLEASGVTTTPAEPTEELLSAAAPAAPATNLTGGFSLARQLGLGVSRIVIDPGHGGHDPGARHKGASEASLVLDIALRLEKLLLAQPGFEVVLTRRTDVYLPLEARTAMANRERADLFLSIHANASRNTAARGIETYVLNFATNPAAEAVAARENSASVQAMRQLPDLLKAIALNNKLDESRDFARMVQSAMIRQLRSQDPGVRDLGVKQAPFVVLIGAGMPSVLAEVSFLTHPREGQLLRSSPYRQRIAEALYDAVLRYQRSLKSVGTVALQ